ncbi:MAG: hypothetical protein ACYCS0_00920 [bacterium]
MRTFILSLAVILSLFICKISFAFTNTSTKTIYPVSSLKINKSKKTVYGIYTDNLYWAVVKKPKITRLTKAAIKKTMSPRVIPYHVKLFMRFSR